MTAAAQTHPAATAPLGSVLTTRDRELLRRLVDRARRMGTPRAAFLDHFRCPEIIAFCLSLWEEEGPKG